MTTAKPRRRRFRGMTLIEVAMALAVSAVVAAGVLATVAWSTQQLKLRATADRVTQVFSAAQQFVQVNYATLAANTTVGGSSLLIPVTGAGTGGPANLPSLQGGGFLGASYVDLNAFNQNHAVLVRQPSSNVLEVLVTTYGGQTIKDVDLGTIATQVGAAGGSMMLNQPNGTAGVVQGVFGGWKTTASLWTSGVVTPAIGHVMATTAFNNGNVISDFLYRYDVGVPEANRMHTDVDVNHNSLKSIANTDTQTINNTTDVTGLVTVNGPLTTSDLMGVGSGTGYFSGRLTANVGITIKGNGAATVDGTAYNNSLQWANFSAGLMMQDTAWLRGYNGTNDLGLWLPGPLKASIFYDVADTSYNVQPSQRSVMNTLEAFYVAPQFLYSETLVYGSTRGMGTYRLGDLLPKYVAQDSQWAEDGWTVNKPTCGPGGAPKLILTIHDMGWGECSGSNAKDGTYLPPPSSPDCGATGGGISVYATDNGASWTVQLDVEDASNDFVPQALATTYCYYP